MEHDEIKQQLRRCAVQYGGVTGLAKAMGVASSSIYGWLRGKKPTVASQIKIEDWVADNLQEIDPLPCETEIEALRAYAKTDAHKPDLLQILGAVAVGIKDIAVQLRRIANS